MFLDQNLQELQSEANMIRCYDVPNRVLLYSISYLFDDYIAGVLKDSKGV